MQDGAQNRSDPRVVGIVRVVIGGEVFDLPVQSVAFESDGAGTAGGFFAQGQELGILVDASVSPSEAKAQIERATEEAVRHLSKRFLN
jgi:hypothetical protein